MRFPSGRRTYNPREYIRFDQNDPKIPQEYDYQTPKKGKDSLHKYIATTVEALLAAIYLDNDENFNLVVKIVEKWKGLVDNSSALCYNMKE